MIAVDTNILARYYVDDPSDPEAKRQRPIAHRLMQGSAGIFVSVTVVLELAWILKSIYGFTPGDTAKVIEHLAGLPNVTVEDWTSVLHAASLHRQGVEFADAMHLARAGQCDAFYTVDDRKFARRAQRLKLQPAVSIPK